MDEREAIQSRHMWAMQLSDGNEVWQLRKAVMPGWHSTLGVMLMERKNTGTPRVEAGEITCANNSPRKTKYPGKVSPGRGTENVVCWRFQNCFLPCKEFPYSKFLWQAGISSRAIKKKKKKTRYCTRIRKYGHFEGNQQKPVFKWW